MTKAEKKTLTKIEVIDLYNGINHISSLNRESGFPVYDFGFEVNRCLARTFKLLKEDVTTLAEEQEPLDKEDKDLRRQRDEALKDAKDGERTRIEDQFDADWKTWRKKKQTWHKETLEVSVVPFKWASVKYKGVAPTPEVLSWLEPLITEDDK